MTQLVCLGVSHHTASVEVREYLSNPLLTRHRRGEIQELAVLATCNRVELYAEVAGDAEEARRTLLNFLAAVHGIPPTFFAAHAYFHTGEAAVRHLCQVAAGLDSRVLGEPQILGQVTSAQQSAQAAGTLGPVLALVFRIAIRVGKRARTETNISANPASVSSVAVNLAEHLAGDLRQRHTLVIGVGEMGELTLKALRGRGVTGIAVANRTRSKAEVVAAEWGGVAYALEALPQALLAADVVFSATNAPRPLITATLLTPVLAGRGGRPLYLIDMAMPRDIAPDVAELPGVRLFNVDDLQAGLDAALEMRQREIPQVERIIEGELAHWQQQMQELAIKPHIVALRQKAESIRQRELARTLQFLGEVDPATRGHLEHLTQALVNHLLHEPTVYLKGHAAEPDINETVETFDALFGLPSTEET